MARKPTKTARERSLLLSQIRRMESRGYRISPEAKQVAKTGSYQTLHSYRRNDYSKLYEQSTANVYNREISGKTYRNIRRSPEQRERLRKKIEEEDRQQAEKDAFEKYFAVGEQIMNNLQSIINTNFGHFGANMLQHLINAETIKYGRREFIASLYFSQDTDLMDKASKLADIPDSRSKRKQAEALYDALSDIITGCKSDLDTAISRSYTEWANEEGEDDESG